MNGTGDFVCENDYKFGSLDDIYPREDREIKPTAPEQRYEKTLLTSAKKSFIFLERQSLIDCLEVDEDYIISAGRDHDINVWDVVEGKHVRRLCGHRAPVTGLSLFDSRHSPFDKIIVSSSEDGSVRVWSLQTGKELNKVDTGSVITCMGVMDKSLAVTGNHKGHLEVRHLRGELYTSIRAHEDPVDALQVHENYACTATFDAPSCLKIWVIQFERARWIYSIENTPEIEFCCMAIWNKKVVLGSSNQPKLFVVNFEDNSMATVDLERSCEKVQRVQVCNGWIISCSLHSIQKRILLDVHRLHNYEHFGTFVSNVQIVKAIASIELYSTFKIVLGGSALEIISFELNLTHETNILARRLKSIPLLHNTPDKNFINSTDDDSEDETSFDWDEKIGNPTQSNYDYTHIKQEDDELSSAILSEKVGHKIQSNYNYIRIKQENDELSSAIFPENTKTEFSDHFESRVSFDCNEKIGNTTQSNYNYPHNNKQENDYDYIHIKEENNELGSPTLPKKIRTAFPVESRVSFDCDEKIGNTMQSNNDYIYIKQENDELGSATLSKKIQTAFLDRFESRVSFDCDEKIEDTMQSNYNYTHNNKQENDELSSPILSEKIQTVFPDCFESRVSTPRSSIDKYEVNVKKVKVKTAFITPPKRTQTLSVLTLGKKEEFSQRIETISPTQNITEPRVLLKTLNAEVDKILHYDELEILTENTENEEENNDDIVIEEGNLEIKFIDDETIDNVPEVIELENEDPMEESEIEATEHLEMNTDIKETETLPILKEAVEMIIKEEIHEENIILPFNADENIKTKNNKKKDKKKESQKTKHRKCQIM